MITTTLDKKDFEKWVMLCVHAFNNNEYSEFFYNHFKSHFLNDPDKDFSDILIAKDEDEIVSSLRIFKRKMYMNGKEIPILGIGEVCTLDAYRGLGLSTKLMNMALSKYQDSNYAFIYLGTGIPNFYRRYGFEETHMKKKIIQCSNASTITENKIIKPIDYKMIKDIYEVYSSKLNGPIVRNDYYQDNWVKTDIKNLLGLFINNILVAYLAYEKKEDYFELNEYGEKIEGLFDEFISLIAEFNNQKLLIPEFIQTRFSVIDTKTISSRMVKLLHPFNADKLVSSQDELLEQFNNNYVFWRTDFF